MSDPSLELQKAIVTALKGYSPSLVGGRVYDDVPPAATFPYISLGDGQVLPDKADCIDGSEVFIQVDVWTQTIGYPEAKRIVKQVLSILDDNEDLGVEGYHTVVFEIQDVRYLRDPDGKTRHAAMTFHGLLQPI